MNILEAKRIPIVDVLGTLGYFPSEYRKAGTDVWYCSPLRVEKTPSFHVNIAKNVWYDNGIGEGGDIFDLLLRIEGGSSDFSGCMDFLNDYSGVHSFSAAVAKEANVMLAAVTITKILPTVQHVALQQYVRSRRIEIGMLDARAHELHYEREGKKYFTLAHKNDAEGWECRSNGFKSCVGRKAISTIVSTDAPVLSVFEGWYDYYALRAWKLGKPMVGTVILLNSLSLVNGILHLVGNYDKVFSFLDNDAAGDAATVRLSGYGNIIDCRDIYYGSKDIAQWWAGI
jgi:hypothetical protein